MIYGLTGVHRCGKTFLAEKIADKYDMYFQQSVIRQSFEQHGWYPDQILTWSQRFDVQNTVIQNMERVLSEAKERKQDTIFDRTPIDIVSYTLTTAIEEGCSDPKALVAYVEKASNLLSHYDVVLCMHSHPDLEYKDEPYKGRKEAQHMRLLEYTMITSGIMKDCPVLPFDIPLYRRMEEAERLLKLTER